MLLSFPTWVIHISSMAEWGIASWLMFQYGKLIQRSDIKKFSLLMLPSWAGGWCVIAFHLSNDSVSFWLDASKVMNCIGSICLLIGTFSILRFFRPSRNFGGLSFIVCFLILNTPQPYPELYWRAKIIDIIFQLSTVVYFVFLVSLILVYRKDSTVFSRVSIIGFWFVLVFVSISVVCIYFSKERGYQTLTHDDLLHGFAESFLTISNLFIVIGIKRKLNQHKSLYSKIESIPLIS